MHRNLTEVYILYWKIVSTLYLKNMTNVSCSVISFEENICYK